MSEETQANSTAGNPLVRGRSSVQSTPAAPEKSYKQWLIDTFGELHPAVPSRTLPEHDVSTRGKSVDSVHEVFLVQLDYLSDLIRRREATEKQVLLHRALTDYDRGLINKAVLLNRLRHIEAS